MAGSIPTSKDEDGPFPISTILDAIHNRLFDEVAGSFHRPAVVWRAPAATINRGILISVVQGCSFVDVSNWAGQDPNASDFRVVCDTDTAYIVFHSCDLPSAAGTVVVVG